MVVIRFVNAEEEGTTNKNNEPVVCTYEKNTVLFLSHYNENMITQTAWRIIE